MSFYQYEGKEIKHQDILSHDIMVQIVSWFVIFLIRMQGFGHIAQPGCKKATPQKINMRKDTLHGDVR